MSSSQELVSGMKGEEGSEKSARYSVFCTECSLGGNAVWLCQTIDCAHRLLWACKREALVEEEALLVEEWRGRSVRAVWQR